MASSSLHGLSSADLALVARSASPQGELEVRRLPAVPWRDPHTVSPAQLANYITMLEKACEQNPNSPDLRTCLGMAYAMNFDAYKSMDVLQSAVQLDPQHFWAQMKYAELHYRLRALAFSEQETLKAVELADNGMELALARRQLQEIRRLMREGTQKPEWSRPLRTPAIILMVLILGVSLLMVMR
jgi:tetratricopeptide (TPR) repeat protein